MTTKQLLELIESEPDADKHIHFYDGEWNVTNEWLCGAFAGRSFSAETKEEAARLLAEYFDKFIGHDSIVGRCVTESGWPDLQKVKDYLEKERKEKYSDWSRSHSVHIQ